MTTIWPVYVPGASVGLATIEATTACGVPVQHPAPGVTDNQLPPFPVADVVRKLIAVPVLIILTFCETGLDAPKALLKFKDPASTNRLVPT